MAGSVDKKKRRFCSSGRTRATSQTQSLAAAAAYCTALTMLMGLLATTSTATAQEVTCRTVLEVRNPHSCPYPGAEQYQRSRIARAYIIQQPLLVCSNPSKRGR